MPRGVKTKLRKEFNLEEELSISTASYEESHEDDADDETDNVVLIDKDGIYGFRTYKYGYELLTRKKFEKDTIVETRIPRTGEIKTEVYKKGTFTNWQLAAYPFHNKLSNVLKRAYELALKDKVSTLVDISNLVSVIDEVENRIHFNFESDKNWESK